MLSAISSQPMCEIEEKAMIFRVWVWFSPVHPPIMVESAAIVSSRAVLMVLWSMYSSASGASFCHVEINMAVVKGVPCRISGYHRCVGASPSFSIIAMVISVVGNMEFVCIMDHSPVCHALRVLANRMQAAAVDWIMKYFVVASTIRGCGCFIIIGRMLRVLSSKLSHASSQWLLANVIIVLVVKLVINTVQIRGFISIGRG